MFCPYGNQDCWCYYIGFCKAPYYQQCLFKNLENIEKRYELSKVLRGVKCQG